MGETSVRVTVWRESIDNTFALMVKNGNGSGNADWEWLKNNTKNTSDYIADCIHTSELSNLQLLFHVVDSNTHEQELFTIEDTEIVYDALAQSPDSGAISEKSARKTVGGANNFNTYSNPGQQITDAEYVLNTSSLKVHYPECSAVEKIAPGNYQEFYGTLEEALEQGCSRCGICFK